MKRYALTLVLIGVGAALSYAAQAVVELKATASGSPVQGTAQLTDGMEGVHLSMRMSGLTPGLHGFHVHEFGSCADAGKAAGSHYNPRGTPHGQILKDGSDKAHCGDMGNLQADAKGNASLEITLPGVVLTGKDASLAGRALIIHEKADDFSQPVGNAGGRVACGPILLVAPSIP